GELGDVILILLSKLLFWIPFFGVLIFLWFFTKWNKYDIFLLFCSAPAFYFISRIIEYSYAESVHQYDFYLKGLVCSIIFYILILFFIDKKK
ncbi:TPA: hypothetical protein ACH6J4_001862, partial [Enterococcus faecium]